MSRYLLGKVTELGYRPDIDGLRALAVLSVIFYHTGFTAFKGGFVGVDVFFVISGYLITRNIASEVQKDTFSFANFYMRRARRLFPALFFTAAVSLAIGAALMIPYHLVDFAKSLVFSIIPASNIYFWKTAGYFSSEAILKPLLHMWSLSVEEQFYLVWPSVLIFLFALRRSWLSLTVLLVTGAGSLAYAEFKLTSDPNGVFFLTQYRVVEFIAGVLCVWLVNHRPKNEIAREISLALGLAMIVYAVTCYSNSTPFPGLNALPPVMGAMLVIYAGAPRYLGRLLANRVAVSVGLISYSLYLVHWPLLVFLTYVLGKEWYVPYSVVIGSLILATLMFLYVETPFRRPAPASMTYKPKAFALIGAGLSIVLISVSLSAWKSGGWLWRLPQELRGMSGDVTPEREKRDALLRQLCESRGWRKCLDFSSAPGIKNIVIFGDSHAVDALNTLHSINQTPHYIVSELGGCPPLVKEDYKLLGARYSDLMRCIQRNESRFSGELLEKADLIVINVFFGSYKPEHLERAINAIKRKTSAPIWVFGNYISLEQELPDLIFKHVRDFPNARMDNLAIDKAWVNNNTFLYEANLKDLSRKSGFVFISKKELLCPEAEVEHCPILLEDGKLFTYDKNHLSYSAAVQLGEKLKQTHPQLMELIR